jgi:uncharacterized protein YjeT (DUF2065 family)
MDLLAAIGLVLILEGLALAIFARSMPALLTELQRLDPGALRRAGVLGIAAGAALYLLVRGWAAG